MSNVQKIMVAPRKGKSAKQIFKPIVVAHKKSTLSKGAIKQAESIANSMRMEGLKPDPRVTALTAGIIDGKLSADKVAAQLIKEAIEKNAKLFKENAQTFDR
jgi:hypothetical protein